MVSTRLSAHILLAVALKMVGTNTYLNTNVSQTSVKQTFKKKQSNICLHNQTDIPLSRVVKAKTVRSGSYKGVCDKI